MFLILCIHSILYLITYASQASHCTESIPQTHNLQVLKNVSIKGVSKLSEFLRISEVVTRQARAVESFPDSRDFPWFIHPELFVCLHQEHGNEWMSELDLCTLYSIIQEARQIWKLMEVPRCSNKYYVKNMECGKFYLLLPLWWLCYGKNTKDT